MCLLLETISDRFFSHLFLSLPSRSILLCNSRKAQRGLIRQIWGMRCNKVYSSALCLLESGLLNRLGTFEFARFPITGNTAATGCAPAAYTVGPRLMVCARANGVGRAGSTSEPWPFLARSNKGVVPPCIYMYTHIYIRVHI